MKNIEQKGNELWKRYNDTSSFWKAYEQLMKQAKSGSMYDMPSAFVAPKPKPAITYDTTTAPKFSLKNIKLTKKHTYVLLFLLLFVIGVVWQYNLKAVAEIRLHSKQLTHLPSNVLRMTNLRLLDVSNNRLSLLTSKIERFSELEVLDLSRNRIESLPQEIGELTQLRNLNLKNNQLTQVPSGLVRCQQLEVLNLSGNSLTSVPAELSKLTQLKKLDLRFNRLTSLPRSLSKCKNLQEIYLRGNPVSRSDISTLPDLFPGIRVYF